MFRFATLSKMISYQRLLCSSQLRSTLIALLLISTLSGCWSSDPEPELTEITSKDGPSVDTPEMALFELGKSYYQAGLMNPAREAFESLKSGYPLGPYVEFAEIKIADSYFYSYEYDTAALLYEEFKNNHPASPAIPYVMLQAGRSHQLSNDDVGRDITPLEKADQIFGELIERYPNSIYVFAARKFQANTRQRIAAYKREVIDYYKRRDSEQAAEDREAEYKAKWAAAENPPEIAARKVDLPVVSSSPAIVVARRGTSASSTDSNSPKTPAAANQSTGSALESGDVRRVDCTKSEPAMIFVHLRRKFDDESFVHDHQNVQSRAGRIVLDLPIEPALDMKLDCFGSQDLTLSDSGLYA